VFFSHCNLRCVFCQNFEISQGGFGKTLETRRLARIFTGLQDRGAHNINLVSPTPYAPAVAQAVAAARDMGLSVPVVYNTGGYENVEVLRKLEGLVDVYLPDLKYGSEEPARLYSGAPDYFAAGTAAVLEMYRQVGVPVLDENGLIRRGLIIRHLVLPGHAADSVRVLEWIAANLPSGVYVSLMSQYFPTQLAAGMPPLDRRVTAAEYGRVVDRLLALGLENGYIQELASATEEYVPDFNLKGVT